MLMSPSTVYRDRLAREAGVLPRDIINFQHDPLACAIACGWQDGVEIKEIPLKSEIKGELLVQSVSENGKPTRVVTRINAEQFNQFWLRTVTRINKA